MNKNRKKGMKLETWTKKQIMRKPVHEELVLHSEGNGEPLKG